MAIVKLSDTWSIHDYAGVFEAAVKGVSLDSPFLSSLEHFNTPGVKWRLAFYARGNENAKPNDVSVFLEAVFGSEKTAATSVWAEYDLTVVADSERDSARQPMKLSFYLPELDSNEGRYGTWGWEDAFDADRLKRAIRRDDGSLRLRLDLRIFKIIDLLKCRDSVRALFSDPQHSDLCFEVSDANFHVHRAVLAGPSEILAQPPDDHQPFTKEVTRVGDATPEAFGALLGAIHFESFRFLSDWKLTVDVLNLADRYELSRIPEYCDDVLAEAIPKLAIQDVLHVLPVAFRCDAPSSKAACVRVLQQTKDLPLSTAWLDFKTENDNMDIMFDLFEEFHVLVSQDAAELETSGMRVPELELEYTWTIPSSVLTPSPASITSPFIFEHRAFPCLKWEAELFPQGDTQASDYKPGFASLSLKAIFSKSDDDIDINAVYAKWNATITTNDGRLYSVPQAPEFVLYTGVKEMKFCLVNGFQIEHLKAAIDPNKGSVSLRLDITIANIAEIIKLRDLISCLDSDKEFADVEIDVSGSIFKSHKCILAVRSPIFAAMFETDMRESKTSKVEVDDITPAAFKAFLAAVYYADWDFLADMDATLDVLKAAEKYGVADLKRYCDEALAHFVTQANLFDVLTHAAIHNATVTKAACVEILFANEQMTRSNGWINFKKSVNTEIMADVAEALGERYRMERKRKREDD